LIGDCSVSGSDTRLLCRVEIDCVGNELDAMLGTAVAFVARTVEVRADRKGFAGFEASDSLGALGKEVHRDGGDLRLKFAGPRLADKGSFKQDFDPEIALPGLQNFRLISQSALKIELALDHWRPSRTARIAVASAGWRCSQ